MGQHHLLGIAGALREGSTNRKLMHEAARLFDPARLTVADLRLPLYDGDLEETEGIPPAVQLLADQVAAADAIVISTPEYNKGPPGVLKNALDWVSRTKPNPWAGKPVAVMSAAGGRAGGERSQMILRALLVPFQPLLLTGPEVHVADSRNQFDGDGRLISDLYLKTLRTLTDKLRAEVGR
ncbi:MAG: NAD(P)H-dependent oxidoreductase [Pseudooceanicola sp.]|nr:NAD(P)H-dependent oxidoreductase [Pseudooceanicola sp.]